jgi:hypothetical protein
VGPALFDVRDEASFLALHGNPGDLAALRVAMTLHMVHGGALRNREIRVLFVGRAAMGGAEKLGKPLIGTLLQRLGDARENRALQGLFVFADDLDLTPAARKHLEHMCDEQPGIVQWFWDSELAANVVRDEGKRGRHYKLKMGAALNLPAKRTLATTYEVDRVARYLNAQHDDLIRVKRRSETGAVTKSFRRCIRVVHAEDVKDF